MTAAVDIFRARAEARAMLVAAGEMGMQDAVDGLQQAADAYGLIGEIGADGVQALVAEAFAAVPRRWVLLNRILAGTVTLLTGDGGVGKTLLAKFAEKREP
jgi:hypothetical protein